MKLKWGQVAVLVFIKDAPLRTQTSKLKTNSKGNAI